MQAEHRTISTVERISQDRMTAVGQSGTNLVPLPGTDELDLQKRAMIIACNPSPGASTTRVRLTVSRDSDLP